MFFSKTRKNHVDKITSHLAQIHKAAQDFEVYFFVLRDKKSFSSILFLPWCWGPVHGVAPRCSYETSQIIGFITIGFTQEDTPIMCKDTSTAFSCVTIAFHWVVGLMVLALLFSGFYMSSQEVYSLYPIHKSFGMTVLALGVMQIGWRLYNGFPQPAGPHAKWERCLARAIHYVLFFAVLAMPLSGILMTAMGGRPLEWFGVTLVGPSLDALGELLPRNKTIAGIAHEIHELLPFVVLCALGLHIAGALKHHLIDRDGTLRRILGGRIG